VVGALNLFIALVAVVTLLALVLGRRRSARSPAWLLLRSLFPSWRFFEQIAELPVLRYRVARAHGDFGPWRDALVPVARTPGSLFSNARGNFALACQSLVERLSDDLDQVEPESVPATVSYQLVQRLVLQRARAEAGSEGARYQFQLNLPDGAEGDAFFLSAVHSLPEP